MLESPPQNGSFAALRRLMRPREKMEHCELCAGAIRSEHPHMVEIATRRLLCSCEACAVLFDNQVSARYRRVPRDTRLLADFRLTDAQWNALQIPIGTAFFFRSTPAERVVAIYPSPAGPVESLLPLDAWTAIAAENPVLDSLRDDVEALLVNRLGAARLRRSGVFPNAHRSMLSAGRSVAAALERALGRSGRVAGIAAVFRRSQSPLAEGRSRLPCLN